MSDHGRRGLVLRLPEAILYTLRTMAFKIGIAPFRLRASRGRSAPITF